ncbi:uncharacterized protein LOC133031992 [Cannabis sativa]|uniref:uncharacterized protein LOC133031992 n=1 Tax=Cannabis sativa TaxID=3483 RepID=UPI0029C9B3FA|nr:uncharacterized protein LOC133031992 [Cannabis sativa]
MSVSPRTWDEDVVRDLFVGRDQDLILSIQLSNSAANDGWSWRIETCGNYSVKSAYKFLQESKGAWCQDANTDFWKRLWSLKIPPKISNFLWRVVSGVLLTCFQLQKRHVPVNADCPLCNSGTETIQHALVEYSFAKAAWHRSIVNVGVGAATFSSWLLGIFTRGHEIEMEEAAMERKGLSLSPLNDGGRNCKRWNAHVLNKIKVNVDGAFFEQEGRFGVGCVARDHHGTMVEVFKKGKIGYVQPEIAEIIGIKEALSWIATHPWDNVVLETDSLVVRFSWRIVPLMCVLLF